MLVEQISRFLEAKRGMSATLKILFGALLMVIILGIIIVMANTLMAEGMEMTEILRLENFIPGGGS